MTSTRTETRSQTAAGKETQLVAPSSPRPGSSSPSATNTSLVRSVPQSGLPAYVPILPSWGRGEQADWAPSTFEVETSLASIQKLQMTIRKAEAQLTVSMGQATIHVIQAMESQKSFLEGPAGVYRAAPDLRLPEIEKWFAEARKWEDTIRTSKQMLSMYAPTIHRYESLDKKRKAEISLTMDMPDDETKKYIFRDVSHEEDYGWGKRARVDESLSAAVSKLSMSV
ncbi:hypothetical protein BGX26_007448, partial [Mortierella sp. AD094]